MSSLDLNLLRVLVAVYEAASVTLAADRLGVTQPTVSYGLGRLRKAYADPLFVRGAGQLVATAVAEQLYRRFTEVLASIDDSLSERAQFDPAQTRRRLRLAMSDIGELYFIPPLLARFSQVAPHIELEVVQASMERLSEELALGQLDAAIGHLPSTLASTRSALLFRERYVCLLSDQHPTIGKRLSLKEFASARHVMVASPFSGHSVIDDVLGQRGIARHIAVRLPHFTVLPLLVAQSDLLVTLPSRIAELYAAQGGLKALDLPVSIPEFDVRVHWHGRQETSPFHRWLVDQVVETLGQL